MTLIGFFSKFEDAEIEEIGPYCLVYGTARPCINFELEERQPAVYLLDRRWEFDNDAVIFAESRFDSAEELEDYIQQEPYLYTTDCWVMGSFRLAGEPARISLDNGAYYIDARDLETYADELRDLSEEITNAMDAGVREIVRLAGAADDFIAFVRLYLEAAAEDLIIG